MMIRAMLPSEERDVLALMRKLWPDCDDASIADDAVFVLERDGGDLGGFISVAIRPWAEGCATQPVAYIEGWWVDAELRGRGVGRELMDAAEEWARGRGLSEVGSDVLLENAGSIAAHGALGFEEVQRVVCFRKQLGR
jgi:aminoglycoside 6'-N-acetyltransferase I